MVKHSSSHLTESPSSSVQFTESIPIVDPHLLEPVLEPRDDVLFLVQLHPRQHEGEDFQSNERLDGVGPVETVRTVGSDHSRLLLWDRLAGFVIEI